MFAVAAKMQVMTAIQLQQYYDGKFDRITGVV